MMPAISVTIYQYSAYVLLETRNTVSGHVVLMFAGISGWRVKSKLKLGSRAIVVGVAMSPRNLDGKYRCYPHPRWRKCTRQFFSGSRVCQSDSIRMASSLGDNIVDHVVCLKAEFLRDTPFPTEMASSTHTTYISVLEQVGVSFNGIAYLMKV